MGEDRISAYTGAAGSRYQSISDLTQHMKRTSGSAFQISLLTWLAVASLIEQLFFLTDESWRVPKSWYAAGGPEKGFRHWFADGSNQWYGFVCGAGLFLANLAINFLSKDYVSQVCAVQYET